MLVVVVVVVGGEEEGRWWLAAAWSRSIEVAIAEEQIFAATDELPIAVGPAMIITSFLFMLPVLLLPSPSS